MTADHPTPAEPLDLAAILERRAAAQRWFGGPHHGWTLAAKSADDVPVLLAELARRDAALADLTRQRDEARAELERWRSGQRRKGMLTVESVPDGLHYAAELVRAQGTEGGEAHDNLLLDAGQRLKGLHDAAGHLLAEAIVLRAQVERQAPVIEAAVRYELAWDQYASFTKHPGINEGQRIATKARAHQELLDVVRALGPVDPEATADDPFDTGAPEHAPPPEAKEVPAGPTDLMAALRASLERAKAARVDATPAPLHVKDGNGGDR